MCTPTLLGGCENLNAPSLVLSTGGERMPPSNMVAVGVSKMPMPLARALLWDLCCILLKGAHAEDTFLGTSTLVKLAHKYPKMVCVRFRTTCCGSM
jgi:hypothetical protein